MGRSNTSQGQISTFALHSVHSDCFKNTDLAVAEAKCSVQAEILSTTIRNCIPTVALGKVCSK